MESDSSLPWLAAPPDESGTDPAAAAGPHDLESTDPGAPERDVTSAAWAPAGRLPWADRVPDHASRARRPRAPGDRTPGGPGGSRPWSPSHHRWDYKRAKNALRALERRLRRIRRLTRDTGPDAGSAVPAADPEGGRLPVSARALLDRYRALEGEVRPLFALQARALVHLDTLDAPALVGLPHLGELGARLLGLSERATWDRFHAGFAFQYGRLLADRYVRGEVGLGHVLALAGQSDLNTRAMIERARSITYRQFRREMRFLGRLSLVGLRWNISPPGVITDPAVEVRLQRRLARGGWSTKGIERHMDERGLGLPSGSSLDPAENPLRMARLEALLDLAILASCREPSEAEELLRGRKTLSTPGRHHRVVVWARPGIRAHWERACRAIRRRDGRLPDWVAAVVVSCEALDQWTHLDPGRLPTERRTLERDGWRCRVPGCGARRNLEVHHIQFRSHGGSNASWNLVTLCHAHHHHALHRGTLRVTGRAPHALTWEIGCSQDAAPLWTYRGERLARRRGQGPIAHTVRSISSPRPVSPRARGAAPPHLALPDRAL